MAPTRKQRLFNSPRGGPKTKGIKYGTAKNARKSIQVIKGQDNTRRKRIAMRMYYRAKFHKYQTPGMRAAMKVWKNYINKIPGVQRGGKCITMEEVATIVQEMYPDADLEDDLDFSYVIESSVLLGTIADPDCITFQEVVHILQRYYRFFTQEEEPAENALNRLQAHVLPHIIKKQNRLGAIKNLGKKRGLPAQINSELASYITGLPGDINSQLAQLNENKQRFGVSLAPRRNTRRR